MEFVNGKDHIPYMKWKIKIMFETTNQNIKWDYLQKIGQSWDIHGGVNNVNMVYTTHTTWCYPISCHIQPLACDTFGI